MAIYYYIFDMDGALFFTDELNNESYNSVLVENNFEPISNKKRITRKTVKISYPEISDKKIAEIICQKQEYFINNISRVQTNCFLFDLLEKIEKDKCILWTSADRGRTESMIKEFDLQRFFGRTIFSDKKHISADMKHICSELACTTDQLLVFENDAAIAKALSEAQVSCFLLIRP